MTWSGEKMAHLSTSTPPLIDNTLRLDRVSGSRQKSCNACVRGKRRCDKRTPNCTRCAAKGLDCVYQRLPPGSTLSEAPTMADFDMNFDMEGLSTDTSPGSLQTDLSLQLDPVLDFSIEDLVSGGSGNGLSPSTEGRELSWNLPQDFGPSKMDLPPVPTVPDLPLRDVSLLQDLGQCESLNVELARLYDPRSKIGSVMKFINSMHHDFAKNRALPYIHPRLWSSQVPKAIMAAWSAATAQANSSPQNKGWTCMAVMDAARDIHREGEQADTVRDKLARVQALLIVQAIKIFDGDITMRSTAEREMGVLINWARDLADVLRQLDEGKNPDEITSRDYPPKDWETWILAESIRRTLLMCMSFACLLALLQGSDMPFSPCEGIPPFYTASKHLWEARSSVQFYRAWRERRQFVIKTFCFAEFWQYAHTDDLDEFTKILLTTQAGPDLMEQQFPVDEGPVPL